MNTKKRGDAGVGVAISYYTLKGVTVSIPISDSQDYDLVVDRDGLKRVQVKMISKSEKNYSVGLRITGGNSKKNFVHKIGTEVIYDILFVVCDNGDLYEIPRNEFKNHKNRLSLSSRPEFKVGNFKL
jgi:hypothetical protein